MFLVFSRPTKNDEWKKNKTFSGDPEEFLPSPVCGSLFGIALLGKISASSRE